MQRIHGNESYDLETRAGDEIFVTEQHIVNESGAFFLVIGHASVHLMPYDARNQHLKCIISFYVMESRHSGGDYGRNGHFSEYFVRELRFIQDGT
jgi:hypothetical protein